MALVVGALIAGGGTSTKGGSRAGETLSALESRLLLIENRVEQIRGVDFERRPLPVLVNGQDVRREALTELDRTSTPQERAADDDLLKMLGLIPPSSNLQEIEGSVLQEQVAGFYDTRTKRLALVRNTGAQDESVAELTLAHELTHALDDQSFGIHDEGTGTDDRASAYNALVEGDATAVMTRYATRYMSGTNLLGALFASSSAAGAPSLPPYILASIEFPYLDGQRFIDALYRYARGWKLVNYAFRFRPPVSTAQILHPLDYVRNVAPRPPRLRLAPPLGRGFRRLVSGTLGEFDTRQLLQRSTTPARAAQLASVWRGGRYELWRSAGSGVAPCAAPCRRHNVLVLAWRTSSPRDAATLGGAVASYVARGLGGRASASGGWTVGGGASALAVRGANVVLAFAPSLALSQIVAARASTS